MEKRPALLQEQSFKKTEKGRKKAGQKRKIHFPSPGLLALGFEAAQRGTLVPVLSLIILRKGLTFSQLSFVFGVFSASAVLMEVPSGAAADFIGRKRIFTVSQIIGMGALLLMMAGTSFFSICTAFLFYGASRAFSSGSMDALYMETCIARKKSKIEKEAVRLEMAEIAGSAGGTLLGGCLNFAGERYSQEAGSFFVLSAALLCTAASLCLAAAFHTEKNQPEEHKIQKGCMRREKQGEEVKEKKRTAGRLFHVCLSTGIFVFIGASSFAGFSAALIETFWQPVFMSLMPESGGSWALGVLSFFYYAVSAAGSFLAGKFLQKEGRELQVFIFSGTMAGGILLMLSKTQKAAPFFILYLALYFFMEIFSTAQSCGIHKAAPEKLRATILSGRGFSLQAGGLLASCLAGCSVEKTGISGLWFLAGAIFLLGTGITAILLKSGRRRAIMEKNREKAGK